MFFLLTIITPAPVRANMIQTLVHSCRGLGCSIFIETNVKRQSNPLPFKVCSIQQCTEHIQPSTNFSKNYSKKCVHFCTTARVIRVKQKAAIRIINNSWYNSHTEPIFKSLSILPLTSLIAYFKIQFMFNFVNGELPGSFESTWIRNENWEGANLRPLLRNHNDIFIPPSRLTSTDKFPLFNFPRVWSSFSDRNIKNLTSKPEFYSKLKVFLLK